MPRSGFRRNQATRGQCATIEPMPLPLSRDTVPLGGSIPSSLVNEIQDCIVAGSHGLVEHTYDLSESINVENFGPNGSYNFAPASNTNTAAALKSLNGMKAGTVITKFFAFAEDAGHQGTITLQALNGAGDPTDVAVLQAFGATAEEKSVDLDHAIASGVRYRALLQTGTGSGYFVVYHIKIHTVHPA